MTMPTPASDQNTRERALDIKQSFAVSAPAGSGKTGLLTLRVLKLLAHCENPEDILCITFTRKAAEEMRERVMTSLRQATNPPSRQSNAHQEQYFLLARQVLQRDKEKNWDLLQSPHRLHIQTVDSFCHYLANQLPLLSKLGFAIDIMDNPEILYRESAQSVLAQLETQSPISADIARLLQHLDNRLDRIEDLLVMLISKRDQWLPAIFSAKNARKTLEQSRQQLAREVVAQVVKKLLPYTEELLYLVRFAAENLSREQPTAPIAALHDIQELPDSSDTAIAEYWLPILEMLLTKTTNSWRASINKNIGFPAGTNKEEKALCKAQKQALSTLINDLAAIPGLLEDLHELRLLPKQVYTEEQWLLLDSLTRILPLLIAELKTRFASQSRADFIEISQAALNALGELDNPSDLALRLDYQIQHILVDEFQDTSTSQLQLLNLLTAGWQADDGRTLFIVGDAMQSCYGFRDANVGIFLDIRQSGLPHITLSPLDLSMNFRSSATIVEWVNRIFKSAYPQLDNVRRGAVQYRDAQAFVSAQADNSVSLIGLLNASDRSAETQMIVEKIQQHRQAQPDVSIAVLVRAKSHLRALIPALKSAGIPWHAIDIDPLISRMAVIDLLSLTRALIDPTDRIAWLSLLRAPWCGLDMHDLHALVNDSLGGLNPVSPSTGYAMIWRQIQHHDKIKSLSNSGRTCVQRLYQALKPALEQVRRLPLRQWIEGTWLRLGGPANLASIGDLNDVQTYLDLLEQYDEAGLVTDWQGFQVALRKLFAKPQSLVANPVQLMTLHKAKGLEFDVVFIPGLDSSTVNQDRPLMRWAEYITTNHQRQLLMTPLAPYEAAEQDSLYSYLGQEEKIKSSLEATRLLYVGCTRARRNLYLLANIQHNIKGELSVPQNSLLASIWEQTRHEMLLVESTTTTSINSNEKPGGLVFSNTIQRLVPTWQAPKLEQNNFNTAPPSSTLRLNDDRHHNLRERCLGILLHRTLRSMAIEGIEQWDKQRLLTMEPFWRAQLLQLGMPHRQHTWVLEHLPKIIAQQQHFATATWILSREHEDSHCELSLVSLTDKREAVIDRTFIDKGERWIIDYKSSEPAESETLEHFLAQQTAQYSQQLHRYRSIFQEREKRPTRLGLYFISLGHLQEIQV